MSTTLKDYLGYGVYVDFDGYSVALTTEDGIDTTNTIVLEPTMFNALVAYWRRVYAINETDEEIGHD